MLLRAQVAMMTTIGSVLHRSRDERGEITSTVAIIGVLVVGALAAGAIVVARMEAHAEAIPQP